MFACLYRPPAPEAAPLRDDVLEAIAQEFSPRYERHGADLVSIDVRGLERLLGSPSAIAHELRREAAGRGVRAHVAIARRHIAAVVLALARPGITVVESGREAEALAGVPIAILEHISDSAARARADARPSSWLGSLVPSRAPQSSSGTPDSVLRRWGLKTLGELAALPPADLAARLGQDGIVWQAIARGEDLHPLVPTLADERFESAFELEWPVEGLEPLSFVLTRLLEPLSTRLERRDRGVAVLHVRLGLVTKAVHARRLELPAPIRDVRTLRTLALVDLESHPPPAAIDSVSIVIDPTPARVLQHTLFTRAQHNPEVMSTLLARLGALMGQDRIGAPVLVDTYRPGAFAMAPFAVSSERKGPNLHAPKNPASNVDRSSESRVELARRDPEAHTVVSVLRRFRHAIPARVAVESDRPVRVTTDRRGFAGGSVIASAGPWRTSGNWWAGEAGRAGEAGKAGGAGRAGPVQPFPPILPAWSRDEWDVALSDGAVYRVFQDRETGGWFIDGVVD